MRPFLAAALAVGLLSPPALADDKLSLAEGMMTAYAKWIGCRAHDGLTETDIDRARDILIGLDRDFNVMFGTSMLTLLREQRGAGFGADFRALADADLIMTGYSECDHLDAVFGG